MSGASDNLASGANYCHYYCQALLAGQRSSQEERELLTRLDYSPTDQVIRILGIIISVSLETQTGRRSWG